MRRWLVGLVVLLLVVPRIGVAQDVRPRTAQDFLPAAETFGPGWSRLYASSPADLAPAFRSAATAYYGGRNGARVSISILVIAPGLTALRESWELANDYFEDVQSLTAYGAGSVLEVDDQPLPRGCAEGRRSIGSDDIAGMVFPVGITLCAVDLQSIVLVYGSGAVAGHIGYEASDAVFTLVVPGLGLASPTPS